MDGKDYNIEETGILRNNPLLVILIIIGIFFVISGDIILSASPPNVSVGLPTFTLGVAILFFCVNWYSNIKTAKKLDEISRKLDKQK
ncbi:MAG: hypothetical protein PHT99_01855 [Methanoregula sp.]|nr:hypothetical protein [Methanoregula sp.]